MRHVIGIVILFAGFAEAAPIRNRPAANEPMLVGQTLTIQLNVDGELVLPGTAQPDLKTFLVGQIDRIKQVAEKSKEKFAPVLVVRTPADVRYLEVERAVRVAERVGFAVRLDSVKKR